MTDFISTVFNKEARLRFLAQFRYTLVCLQTEKDKYDLSKVTARASVGGSKKKNAQPSSYVPAIHMVDACIAGTTLMQVWVVYVALFYTTDTERYFSSTTRPEVMNKVMVTSHVYNDAHVIHAELYDEMRTLCFGRDANTPHVRDHSDMRTEYRMRGQHPHTWLTQQMGKLQKYDVMRRTTTS